MSRFEVLVSGRVIGASDFETQDESTGIAQGRFLPGPEYEFLRPIFRLWAEATMRTPQDDKLLARYFEAVSKLSVTVRSTSGVELPTEWVHITDYSPELGAEGFEVAMSVTDWDLLERTLGHEGGS